MATAVQTRRRSRTLQEAPPTVVLAVEDVFSEENATVGIRGPLPKGSRIARVQADDRTYYATR